MNDKKDFPGNIKDLSVEDLLKYKSAAQIANSFFNVVGILVILLIMYNPTMYVMLVGLPVLFFLAGTGANIKSYLVRIKKELLIKDK